MTYYPKLYRILIQTSRGFCGLVSVKALLTPTQETGEQADAEVWQLLPLKDKPGDPKGFTLPVLSTMPQGAVLDQI